MKAVVVVFCIFQSVVNVQVVTSFKVYSNLPSVSATSTSHPSSPLSIVTSTLPPSATLSSRVSHAKSATATATNTVAATATAGPAVKLRTTTAATAAAVKSTTVSAAAAGVAAAATGIGVGTLPKAAVAAAGAAAATIGNTAISSTTYLGQKTEIFCQKITTTHHN
jgi:hypothetical protein